MIESETYTLVQDDMVRGIFGNRLLGNVDPERTSTMRLLEIGGKGLDSPHFFLRAGRFDASANERSEELRQKALGLTLTEF